MSYTFTLTGYKSELSETINPPIELDPRYEYSLRLLSFHSYNTIANVIEGKNKFYYDDDKIITIPVGAYEIADIETYLNSVLPEDVALFMEPNHNTLTCEIMSSVKIDFTKEDCIGRLLGFSEQRLLEPGKPHQSDLPVYIIKVSKVRILCSIVTGAYYDGRLTHDLYQFSPEVEPGYAINIAPETSHYLPIIPTTNINNITINLVDQDGDEVDFRGERIIVTVELKKSLIPTTTKWD